MKARLVGRWRRWRRAQRNEAPPVQPIGDPFVRSVTVYGAASEMSTDQVALAVHQLTVSDFGTGIGSTLIDLFSAGEPLLDGLGPQLPSVVGDRWDVTLRPEGAPRFVEVEFGWDGHRSRVHYEDVPDVVVSGLTRRVLDSEAEHTHIHAGMVTDRTGRGAVLMGQSGSGKSTLTAHLVDSGLTLINDEQLTVFPEAEMLGGFSRPISIKPAGSAHAPTTLGDLSEHRLLSPTALGARFSVAGRPAILIELDRCDEAEALDWSALTPGQAVLRLCANNLDLVRRPTATLEAFGWLATTVPMVSLHYREAVDAVPGVIDLLDASPPASQGGVCILKVSADGQPGRLGSATPSQDVVWLELDEECVLYRTTTREIAALSGSAAAWWSTNAAQASPPASLDSAATRKLVQELTDLGFLE